MGGLIVIWKLQTFLPSGEISPDFHEEGKDRGVHV